MSIPRVHQIESGNDDDNNPITLMDLIPGSSLYSWNHKIPLYKRQHFLEGLAEFLLELWSTQPPDTCVKESYSQWLRKSLDRALRRTLTESLKWGDTIDYLIMRTMIPYYAEDVENSPEMGIAHGDMNAKNIIVDDDMTLMGVIDWDWTYTAPLPAVVQFPWFLADIPGWHNDHLEKNECFNEDRGYLVDALRKKIHTHPSATLITKLLEDAWKRQFFQSAIHYRSIHEEFVKCYCHRTDSIISAAIEELEAFLQLEENRGEYAGLERARAILLRRGNEQ